MKRYLIFDFDGTLLNSENILETQIYKIIQEYTPQFIDTFRYIGNSLNGYSYKEVLQKVFTDSKEIDFLESKIKQMIDEQEKNFGFFPGVAELLESLSRNYTLFISTGGYTKNVESLLKKGGLFGFFAHIQGSENIPKSSKHIEIFKEITGDQDFEKFSLSIGDGQREKEVAIECGIDFVHIGTDASHHTQIPIITMLPEILNNFSNTSPLEIGEQNYIL